MGLFFPVKGIKLHFKGQTGGWRIKPCCALYAADKCRLGCNGSKAQPDEDTDF